mmetsp:Transcript_44267/g.85117  ORF Transcript_44267/g.85117 Transcript_44267/m.85117 type:complete len:1011 (+) Transcript_44267:53-3085(+)
MIASGELFLLNGGTGGELRPLPRFLNRNVRVVSSNFDRLYVGCEPPVCPPGLERSPCDVWCFQGDKCEPTHCPEFGVIGDTIRQIAVGSSHMLVLTQSGAVYSRGTAFYGSTGHGGAKDVPDFALVPALKQRRANFVAAGPHFSVVITESGDVYSWGQAFHGETGLLSQVEAVPRFAHEVSKYRIVEVSCGSCHVVARTEALQCLTWGENSSGQLGVGKKCKPMYRPNLLESIPSEIQGVSAGWAHTVAVGSDGAAYAWGLNSHGQLGVGDNNMRMAPELLHGLKDQHHVESALAAKTMTIFLASSNQALLCGQIPCSPGAELTAAFGTDQFGNTDTGCLLTPLPLALSAGCWRSELSSVLAFDGGALGFARSKVFRVAPNLAPVEGGTRVRVYMTGLPFDEPREEEPDAHLVQHSIPVRVRLRSELPACECVVDGTIVAADTVEFESPDVTGTPLGTEVLKDNTIAVQLKVSIDGGLTWTPERHDARELADLMCQGGPHSPLPMRCGDSILTPTQREEELQQAKAAALLWYCWWPKEGPSHVEPTCAVVTGSTEVLLNVALPRQLPADYITVKFTCEPLLPADVPPPEVAATAVVDELGDGTSTLDAQTPCQVPAVECQELSVCAWLEPGRGVKCNSPPFDAETLHLYKHSLQLSLDGRVFLPRILPCYILNPRMTGLEPCLGPLLEETRVSIKATGLADSSVRRVRLTFPAALGWAAKELPINKDCTSGELWFVMPNLAVEVRHRMNEMAATAVETPPVPPATATETIETGSVAGDGGLAEAAVLESPATFNDGGLHATEVQVELSLNGQDFTRDNVSFMYYRSFATKAVQVVATADGANASAEPAKEDPKGKKASKANVEEVTFITVAPGSKLGIPMGLVLQTSFAVLRVALATKIEGEEPQPFREKDLPAQFETIVPPPPPPPEPDPKAKNAPRDAPPPEKPLDPTPIDMITALAPGIGIQELPEGAVLLMTGFSVSMNGRSFVPCPPPLVPLRLEPLPANFGGDF